MKNIRRKLRGGYDSLKKKISLALCATIIGILPVAAILELTANQQVTTFHAVNAEFLITVLAVGITAVAASLAKRSVAK